MSFTVSDLEMQVMFDGSPNGLAIFRRNDSGTYICCKVNTNFANIAGCTPETDVVGQSLVEIFANQLPKILELTRDVIEQKKQRDCIVTCQDQDFKVAIAPIEENNVVSSVILAFNPSWRYSPQFYGNQKLLDSMHDAIFIFDVDENEEFRLSYLNETHQNATGLDIIRDYGKSAVELAGDDQGKLIIERYQKCVDEKDDIQYEEMLVLPSGTRWWETKISPVIVNGKVIQIIGTSRDITKEKQYSKERDTLLQEYRNVFDYNMAPMALYEVDEENETFRLVRHNRSCEIQTGLLTTEYAGKTLLEMVDEASGPLVQRHFLKCLQTKEPVQYEEKLTVLGVTKYWATVIAPIIYDDKVERIILSSMDVTEQRTHEEEIQKLLFEYSNVFDFNLAPMGLFEVDEDQEIFTLVRFNQAYEDQVGLTTEKYAGENIEEILRGETLHIVKEKFIQCLRTKKPVRYEQWLTVLNQKKWWITLLAPIIENGRVVKIIGSSLDISERQKHEDRIQSLLDEYMTVFDAAQAVMWVDDYDAREQSFRVNKVNAEFIKQTGLKLKDVHSKTIFESTQEPHSTEIWRHHMDCVKQKLPVSYEENLEIGLRKGVFLTTLAPIFKNGNVSQVVGSSVDITEIKENEKRTQALLEEYMTVFDNTQTLMWVTDYDEVEQSFRVNKINRKYAVETGADIEKIEGKTIFETNVEPYATTIWERHMACVKQKIPMTYEVPLHFGDRKGTFLTIYAPIFKNGKIVQVAGSALEITELKENEKKIQTLLDEYMTVFDTTQTVMWVNDYDEIEQSFRVNKVNRQYTIETGIHFEEIKGKTIFETTVEPNSTAVWERHMECVKQKQLVTYEEYIEVGNRPGTFLTTYAPLIKDGKVVQVVGSSLDITEIKENEKKTQALLDEYMTVFDANQAVIWVNDYDEAEQTFRVNKINRQYTIETGIRFEEIKGKTIFETSVEPYSTEIKRRHMECVRAKKSITYEESLIVGNRQGNYLTTLAPIMEGDQVVQVTGSSVDITELKAYQNELKLQRAMLSERVKERTLELQKALLDKDAFLSWMSAEINAPVSAILGFSELLKRLTNEDAANYRYIEQIYRYTQNLSTRFRELMSVVSLDEKRNELDFESFDLEELFRSTIGNYQKPDEAGGLQIDQHYDLPTPLIWLDAKRTRLIIHTICEMADRKNNNTGGKFTVKVTHQNSGQQLRFRFNLVVEDLEVIKHGISYQEALTQNGLAPGIDSFDLDIMVIERAVEMAHGTIAREWIVENLHVQIIIEIPLLQNKE